MTVARLRDASTGVAEGRLKAIARVRLRRADLAMRIYAALLLLATVALATALVTSGYRLGDVWAVAALAVLAAIAERGRVRIGANIELSISLVPILFAAVVFGPLAAMVVGAAAMTGDVRSDRMKWAIWTFSEAITGGLTGLAALHAADLAGNPTSAIAAAAVVGAVMSQLLDGFFAVVTFVLRRRSSPVAVARALAPVVAISVPLYTPIVALLAYAYLEVSKWSLALFLAPALAAQRLFTLYQEERRLARDLMEANARLERANLSFASALVATLDARDRYTAGHSAAVARYARDIAARMGLSERDQELVHLCGLVHDIGKVGLPAGLLEKPGPLTQEERREMERHSEIGERILANVDDYAEIAAVVRHHHERVDGKGYPDGIKGDAIPLLSRIIGVADAYDAMTSDRPYRDAMPTRVARIRLAEGANTQFDAAVVDAFESILAKAPERYRLGRNRPEVREHRVAVGSAATA